MAAIAPYLVAGVVTGSILVLPAIAFSVLYSILRFPNFAIGAYMTAGAYVAFAANRTLGWPIAPSLAAGILGTALIAVVVDRLTFRLMRQSRPLALLVTSIGVAFVLENLARFFWGNELQSYDVAVRRPWTLGPVRVNGDQLWIIAVAAVFLVFVHLLLRRTRIGKAMRATADNRDLASVRGIDPERIVLVTTALGGALAGAAGVLLGIDSILSPTMGGGVLILVFASAILGGIGSAYGAMLGALAIALVAEMSTAVFPPTYKTAFGFVIMALLLLIRPRGLLAASRST